MIANTGHLSDISGKNIFQITETILNFSIICEVAIPLLPSILMKGFFCILDCAGVCWRWSMINIKLWSINILYQRTLHKILGHNFVVWPIQEAFYFPLTFIQSQLALQPQDFIHSGYMLIQEFRYEPLSCEFFLQIKAKIFWT